MRVKRRKTMALLAAVSIVCAQSTVSDVFAAGAEEVAAQENNAVSIEYLTLQPGERDDSVNLNWYAPEGTQNAIVRMGDKTVEASVRALHTPTKVVEGKYTDTGKIVCQATVSGLSKGTEYSYQISYDNGNTWSKKYSYETPNAGEFRFGFTSDPQIKENGETNNGGWNPSDGKNQTGWAVMLDKMKEEDVNLIVSAGDQVEDQSWGKSSEYAAFFAPEEMTSLLYAPAVGNHDRHYMFDDHFNLPNEMSVDGNAASLNQVKTTFRGQNSGTSQSHGNYIQATADEIAQSAESNGVTPNKDGQYDFVERREMETKGNYYYLYNNVLFVTLNTGAYPGGNDNENAGNVNVPTVTVIDLTNQNVSHLDFTVFDSEAKRAELVQNGVILKKGTAPSVDLEPEYIAANDKTAYVTLQEANAIAIVDLQTLSIENICSAGYEDYEKYPIDIDKKDAAYRPVSYPSLRGIRMPDGISLFESNGKTYIVTANEGDSREWNEYLNEAECNFGKGQTSPSGKITAENSGLTGKVVFFDQNDYEGLNSEYDYLFGGRSFTVYCVDGSGMKEVYTSGNELEAKTAAYFPQYFNCSNDSAEIDDRSGKKGVEAESVTIGTVGEKTYAFIGLERIGGVMAYDITNPDKILFANYINSRDFSKDIAGDVSPEGLCMISASESADGNAYLLASCEVSGTVAAYKLISQNIDSSDDDNTDNNHDNNIDHNGSGHGGADTEDLNNQESKTNALKTGDHAPVIGTGIGMVLALSAIIVILKYRRSKNTITNTK